MSEIIVKKSALPTANEFEKFIALQKYIPLVDSINVAKRRVFCIDAQYLEKLAYSLQVLSEKSFGKSSPKANRVFVKLPSKLFKDYSVPGPLYTILTDALDYLEEHQSKSFEDSFFSKFENTLKLFKRFEENLLKGGFLRYPVVFLTESVSSIAEELRRVIVKHGGTLVASRDEATHIIEWDDEIDGASTNDASEEFIRTIEVRVNPEGNSKALVHWWYYPDSYDQWISAQDMDFSDTPDSISDNYLGKRWRICSRFIRDVEIFNEWGNEVDYELDEEKDKDDDEDDLKATRGVRGRKTKSRVRRRLDDSKKRSRESVVSQVDTPVPEAIMATARMSGNQPPPSNDVSRDAVRVLVVEPSELTKGSTCVIKEEKPVSQDRLAPALTPGSGWTEATSITAKNDPDEPEVKKSKLSLLVQRPSWFTNDDVSATEKRFLPEFFDGTSQHRNQKSYLQLRNFIITLSDLQPTVYLSATDCRRKLAMDVSTVVAVHEFLDAFGVINIGVRPEARPQLPSLRDDSLRLDDPAHSKLVSPDSVTWTAAEDDALLAALNSIAEEPDPNLDWGRVAEAVSQSAGGDVQEKRSKSGSDCLLRFVCLPLSATTGPPSACGSSSDVEGALSMYGSANSLAALSSAVARRAVSALGTERASAVVRAATEVLTNMSVAGTSAFKVKDEFVNTAAVAVSAAAYSLALSEETTSVAREKASLVDEQTMLKLRAFEDKMKLLTNIQRDLESERIRQEGERRDLQIQRAMLAFAQKEK